MTEFPRDMGFGTAAVRAANKFRATGPEAPEGRQVEIRLAFQAYADVEVECEVTVERIAAGCRAIDSYWRTGYAPAQAVEMAEGKPPRYNISTLHPHTDRWNVSVPIPLPPE